MPQVEVKRTLQGYALFTEKSSTFLSEFKRVIPARARAFSGTSKCWYVDPAQRSVLASLLKSHFGYDEVIPELRISKPPEVTRTVRLDYLGQAKLRDDGTTSAAGSVSGDWSVYIPENALRAWFEGGGDVTEPPSGEKTLYGRLGVRCDASEREIKSAFRRLVRQWHPDVCREEDASKQFRAIQAAWEVLSEPQKRRRYDAGLAFERQSEVARGEMTSYRTMFHAAYRAPLRCGLVSAEWTAWLGRLTARRILSWDDIVDERGRTMVSSWQRGAEKFTIEWVDETGIPF